MKLLSILSPVVQKPTVSHPSLNGFQWCNNPSSDEIWTVLHHPEVYPLILKACRKILTHYNIDRDEHHDIIIDAILDRLRTIQDKNGLTFPSRWKPGFSWKAWLYVIFHNVSRTLIHRQQTRRIRHSLEELEESGTLSKHLADHRFSPEELTLYQEQKAYIAPLQILEYIVKSKRIAPPKRLYYLLLHHPELITFQHLESAYSDLSQELSPFHRSLEDAWKLWCAQSKRPSLSCTGQRSRYRGPRLDHLASIWGRLP